LRVYADNFYAASGEESVCLSGLTGYMITAGVLTPLFSIASYLYSTQYWFLQLLYITTHNVPMQLSIPNKEKCLSLMCNPLSYLLAPVSVAMIAFFCHSSTGIELQLAP